MGGEAFVAYKAVTIAKRAIAPISGRPISSSEGMRAITIIAKRRDEAVLALRTTKDRLPIIIAGNPIMSMASPIPSR
jgi:hypothetical protein